VQVAPAGRERRNKAATAHLLGNAALGSAHSGRQHFRNVAPVVVPGARLVAALCGLRERGRNASRQQGHSQHATVRFETFKGGFGLINGLFVTFTGYPITYQATEDSRPY
jgi:hypothetical protein